MAELKEQFIPRTTKAELDRLISVLNGDGSGFEIVKPGLYRSLQDSEYFNLKKGEEYEFVKERCQGVIVKLVNK